MSPDKLSGGADLCPQKIRAGSLPSLCKGYNFCSYKLKVRAALSVQKLLLPTGQGRKIIYYGLVPPWCYQQLFKWQITTEGRELSR